jgi:CBS domain-containing protein
MKVREVMSKDVLVASPDDTIEKAATLMAQVDCAVSSCRGKRPLGRHGY